MLPRQPQHPAQHGPGSGAQPWMRTACARRRWTRRWPMAPIMVLCTPRAQTPPLRPERAARPRTAPRARPPSARAGDRGRPLRLAGRDAVLLHRARGHHAAGAGALRVQGLSARTCGWPSSLPMRGPAARLGMRLASARPGSATCCRRPCAACSIRRGHGAPACGQDRLRHASQGPDRCTRRRGHRRQAALRRIQCGFRCPKTVTFTVSRKASHAAAGPCEPAMPSRSRPRPQRCASRSRRSNWGTRRALPRNCTTVWGV